MSVIGVDIGTTGSRAVLVREDGVVIATATAPHVPFASPETGWAEQDPDNWWEAVRVAVREMLSARDVVLDDVTGIGLSGQMHGAVLLDHADRVVRPAIIWCDQRTDEQCRRLTEDVGARRLIELVCNPALTGFTLPKLLWVREHEPGRWDAVRTVLLPKDYVRLRLTGERATDVADASGTLLFDVAHRRWSTELLECAQIDANLLPSVYEGHEISGRLTPTAAQALGLRPGLPVVAGGGDQAAGAVGMGVVRPGTVSVTIGTSGVVFAATDRPSLDALGRVHTFCHAVPGRWHVMGVTQGAGLSLRWFRDTFGIRAGTEYGATGHVDAEQVAGEQGDPETGGPRDPYEVLCDEAATAPVGSRGALWAPYLMGERTPHLDPHARAALVGLTASHTRADIVRSILEGVAFSLKDSLSIVGDMGLPTDRIRLGGGGARSSLWRQIQADVYGRPVECLAAEEGAAYGAAILAGVGTGLWATVEEACDAVTSVSDTVRPVPRHVSILSDRYEKFSALYRALHPE